MKNHIIQLEMARPNSIIETVKPKPETAPSNRSLKSSTTSSKGTVTPETKKMQDIKAVLFRTGVYRVSDGIMEAISRKTENLHDHSV